MLSAAGAAGLLKETLKLHTDWFCIWVNSWSLKCKNMLSGIAGRQVCGCFPWACPDVSTGLLGDVTMERGESLSLGSVSLCWVSLTFVKSTEVFVWFWMSILHLSRCHRQSVSSNREESEVGAKSWQHLDDTGVSGLPVFKCVTLPPVGGAVGEWILLSMSLSAAFSTHLGRPGRQ